MLLTLTRILDEQPPIWLISLNQSRGKCQMLLYYIYAVYTQWPITLQITSKWCYYKLMGLNYLKNKKHCCINGIMKNNKISAYTSVLWYNTFGTSLVLSLTFFFLDFLILALQFSKLLLLWPVKQRFPKLL